MIIKSINKDRYDSHITYNKSYVVLGVFQSEKTCWFAVISDSDAVVVLLDKSEIEIMDHNIPFGWGIVPYRDGFIVSAKSVTTEFWDIVLEDTKSAIDLLKTELENIKLFHGISGN